MIRLIHSRCFALGLAHGIQKPARACPTAGRRMWFYSWSPVHTLEVLSSPIRIVGIPLKSSTACKYCNWLQAGGQKVQTRAILQTWHISSISVLLLRTYAVLFTCCTELRAQVGSSLKAPPASFRGLVFLLSGADSSSCSETHSLLSVFTAISNRTWGGRVDPCLVSPQTWQLFPFVFKSRMLVYEDLLQKDTSPK